MKMFLPYNKKARRVNQEPRLKFLSNIKKWFETLNISK